MHSELAAPIALAAVLALSACSASNDDEEALPGSTTGGENAPPHGSPDAPASMPDGSGPPGEAAPDPDTSGVEMDEPLDPSPSGDDTSVLAGLWNASTGPAERRDERYVAISANGLYTDYDFRDDGVTSDGNCYLTTPRRLDVVVPAEDSTPAIYRYHQGIPFIAWTDAGGTTLNVSFGDPEELEALFLVDGHFEADQSWSAVVGTVEEDLQSCGG